MITCIHVPDFNCCTQNHMYTLASLSNHKLLWTSVCGVDYIHLMVGIQLALFPASRTRAREWGYIQLTPCLYYSVLKQNEADMARSKQAQAKQEKHSPVKQQLHICQKLWKLLQLATHAERSNMQLYWKINKHTQGLTQNNYSRSNYSCFLATFRLKY